MKTARLKAEHVQQGTGGGYAVHKCQEVIADAQDADVLLLLPSATRGGITRYWSFVTSTRKRLVGTEDADVSCDCKIASKTDPIGRWGVSHFIAGEKKGLAKQDLS